MTFAGDSEEQLQRREALIETAAEDADEDEDDYFDNDVEYATDEYLAGLCPLELVQYGILHHDMFLFFFSRHQKL
jgi:hypothetical protein